MQITNVRSAAPIAEQDAVIAVNIEVETDSGNLQIRLSHQAATTLLSELLKHAEVRVINVRSATAINEQDALIAVNIEVETDSGNLQIRLSHQAATTLFSELLKHAERLDGYRR